MGVAVGVVSRSVYWVEDAFEHLPVHWMWWPALGAASWSASVGFFSPHTLGVGYDNIDRILSGDRCAGRRGARLLRAQVRLVGRLAGERHLGRHPGALFTLGGGLGVAARRGGDRRLPSLGVDVRMAALVGMAAMFAGASRAFLASVVFAFETTRQPIGLLPLLGGSGAAVLVSSLLMSNSIMTEKIARRGARVLGEYAADFLDTVLVRDHAPRDPVTLAADDTVDAARAYLRSPAVGARHTGFPVIDATGDLVGVVTRAELLEAGADGAAPLRGL